MDNLMISENDTVYISGAITGIEDVAIPFFFNVERYLKLTYGCQVLNPVRQPQSKTWTGYMRHDVELLEGATVLLQLPGWQLSKGANIEYDLSLMHGYLIIGLPEIVEFKRAA